MLNDTEMDAPALRTLAPEVCCPLEHVSYVGTMPGAVDICLRQLLGRELPEPGGLIVERPRDPSTPENQTALSRLSDQAERLAQTIMSGAHRRDWRASPSHEIRSPHALVHLAIDEAAEHLGEAFGAVLPDTPVAVAAPGLLLDGRTVPGGSPGLAGLTSASPGTRGGIVRRAGARVR